MFGGACNLPDMTGRCGKEVLREGGWETARGGGWRAGHDSGVNPSLPARRLWSLGRESLGDQGCSDSTPSSSHTASARWKVALAAGMPQ